MARDKFDLESCCNCGRESRILGHVFWWQRQQFWAHRKKCMSEFISKKVKAQKEQRYIASTAQDQPLSRDREKAGGK